MIDVQNSDDATKATYFTPRLAGFQLGASYSPDTNDDGGLDNNNAAGRTENHVGVGVNWTDAFGGVALTVAAVGSMA